MGDAAVVRVLFYILGYVIVLLVAFVAVYLLLHRLTREERADRHGGTKAQSRSLGDPRR